jgi:hypothetical protein
MQLGAAMVYREVKRQFDDAKRKAEEEEVRAQREAEELEEKIRIHMMDVSEPLTRFMIEEGREIGMTMSAQGIQPEVTCDVSPSKGLTLTLAANFGTQSGRYQYLRVTVRVGINRGFIVEGSHPHSALNGNESFFRDDLGMWEPNHWEEKLTASLKRLYFADLQRSQTA